jgi:hypothetical protein
MGVARHPVAGENRRVRISIGPALLVHLGLLATVRAGAPAEETCDVYYFGIGQRPDLGRAFACEMAEPEPRRNWVLLAVMHLNGEGTPRDLRLARQALEHNRPDACGATCAALDAALRRREGSPGKTFPRVDYCKDIAQTTVDSNYCLGIDARKESVQRKVQARRLGVDLTPAARKRFASLGQAFARFKEADGGREYQNFKDGTIRDEASDAMEKRVGKHYQAALAKWGPQATELPPAARPLAEADRELNAVYRTIMTDLDARIGEARAVRDPEERERGVQDLTEVKTATRDAERAWLRYATAWKDFLQSVRPDDPEAPERLRAFLTEQRIRELKYPSIGEPGALDPEEE